MMFNSASKYCFYLDDNSQKSLELFLVISKLENYVNGAIIQMRRLEKQRSLLQKAFQGKKFRKNKFLLTYLSCDTHFFFICVDKIYKLLNVLGEAMGEVEIKKLKTNINKTFDISTVRNHLEHIEDRCLGYLTTNKKIKTQINDFGNFYGADFSFNNKRFPSSKKSLNEIKNTYRGLIKIIDKKCRKNPNFVINHEKDKGMRKIMRALKKAGFMK